MKCNACDSKVTFAMSNGRRIKIIDQEIDIDCEGLSLSDFSDFRCGSCSSQDIEGIEDFLEKVKRENFHED